MISYAKTRQWPWQNIQRRTAPANRDGAAIVAAVTVHSSCATIFCSAAEIRGPIEEDIEGNMAKRKGTKRRQSREARVLDPVPDHPGHRMLRDSRSPSRSRSLRTGHPSRPSPCSNSSRLARTNLVLLSSRSPGADPSAASAGARRSYRNQRRRSPILKSPERLSNTSGQTGPLFMTRAPAPAGKRALRHRNSWSPRTSFKNTKTCYEYVLAPRDSQVSRRDPHACAEPRSI